MQPALIQYNKNIEEYKRVLTNLRKKRNNLGWIRLFTVLATFGISVYLFSVSLPVALVAIAVGIALFLIAVALDVNNSNRIAHTERMLNINEQEVSILHHRFDKRPNGLQYLPHEHPYAADLDLFGGFSIYQYINRCTSAQAADLLAAGLLSPTTTDVITARQAAARELAPQLEWRQELQAAGMDNPVSYNSQERINNWLQQEMPYKESFWKPFLHVYSIITISCVVAYIFDLISATMFSGLAGVFFVFGLYISRYINPTFNTLSKIVTEVGTLQQQLQYVEKLQPEAPLLQQLQKEIKTNGQASTNIQELKKILNRFDYRLNILVFFVLNSLLLWDLRQQISLNNWRKIHAGSIPLWFKAIAEIEVLQSLAALIYNHPDWCFPKLKEEHFALDAVAVGHPLIKQESRVVSSFNTKGKAKVSIITGSNMAGKSTFLRSLGVNIVLAQLGAPVCAASFSFSPVQLYSSMRIADNLAENTSTFYAELKKLKSIIDQVNQHEKVFILLDEILRGTNSLDRHTGSEALIKQLILKDAVAVIATHDVELAALEKSFPSAISNYHFDVQVEGEELYFDYKLKGGVCYIMNASILMKKIGIEM